MLALPQPGALPLQLALGHEVGACRTRVGHLCETRALSREGSSGNSHTCFYRGKEERKGGGRKKSRTERGLGASHSSQITGCPNTMTPVEEVSRGGGLRKVSLPSVAAPLPSLCPETTRKEAATCLGWPGESGPSAGCPVREERGGGCWVRPPSLRLSASV